MNNTPTRIIAIGIALIIGVFAALVALAQIINESVTAEYRNFSNCSSLARYINQNREEQYYYEEDIIFEDGITRDVAVPEASSGSEQSVDNDFSETNIQVEGVDESDVVKTHGSYLYVLRGASLVIINVQDPNNPTYVRDLSIGDNPRELFLHNDTLVVFKNDFSSIRWDRFSRYSADRVVAEFYSLEDPENPSLQREITVQGTFNTARLTQDTVYIVTQNWLSTYDEVSETDVTEFIPVYKDSVSSETGISDGYQRVASCETLSALGNSVSHISTVAAVPLNANPMTVEAVLGDSPIVYMSKDNLYVTSQLTEYAPTDEDYPQESLIMPRRPIRPPRQISDIKTAIARIEIKGTELDFVESGEIRGTLLNQFSLDEHNGYLRVAANTTTEDEFFPEQSNSVYTINIESMEQEGVIDNLGVDERIYAARFMGDRAYLVTFRETDPFYVLDLTNPEAPTMLGELKIPGFSNYLHPYDRDTVIGIGKEATNSGRVTGLKVSLYNVSDVANPIVQDEIIYEYDFAESVALRDHKAFLFDKEKNLLVIPAQLEDYNFEQPIPFEVDPVIGLDESVVSPEDKRFNGFLVFNITSESLSERGKIAFPNDLFWFSDILTPRALYINDSLVTLRESLLQVHNLETLEKVGEIVFEE